MRINLPVTQREFALPSDATLMSTTDLKGRITYANAAFVTACGFSAESLHGKAHNIVRHPDMPAEAFADMWRTLQGGESWTAVVKNRRCDGDHYWVRANATPVVRQGRTLGYLSVRTVPTREEVAAAEALYAQMREGRSSWRLFKGVLLRRGVGALWNGLKTASVRTQLLVPLALLGPVWILAATVLGVHGTTAAALAAAAGASLGAVALWLEYRFVRPLQRLRAHAQATANGEPRAMPLDRVDELGMMARAVDQLGLMLRWIVDDVAEQVTTVNHATDEIAVGNQDLSARTEQSSASLEETASSMEQISGAVQTSARSAAEAARITQEAEATAHQSRASFDQVGDSMAGILDASRRIEDIIGVIDGIAFQTNLLALNAAVEAARAGEQGRGFAVVAGEVRQLAHRSAEASREIKGLIHDSARRVDAGAGEVGRAGAAIRQLTTEVERVHGLIEQMHVASSEQALGIEQINVAVGLLDRNTQQNAALVEQSAAAAESLRHQSHQLLSAVSAFRAKAG